MQQLKTITEMTFFFRFSLMFLYLSVGGIQTATAQVTPAPSSINQFDEFEQLKKQGDDLFVQGRYEDAVKKYRVSIGGKPETDNYARKKIEQCQLLIGLKNEAQNALKDNRGDLAVDKWKRVVAENQTDGLTKKLIATYWGDLGNKAYTQKKFDEAKAHYAMALSYDPDNTTWAIQIENANNLIAQGAKPSAPVQPDPQPAIDGKPVVAQPQPKSPVVTEPIKKPTKVRYKSNTVPKVLALLVGAGAGNYAYQLRSDYNTQTAALNQVSQRVDPDGDNIVIGSPGYSEWETAYTNAQAAYNRKGLATACIGVAAVAVVAEVYLFVKKRKPRESAVQIVPASGSYGVALRLKL